MQAATRRSEHSDPIDAHDQRTRVSLARGAAGELEEAGSLARQAAEGAALAQGDCPSNERLVNFAEGRLQGEDVSLVDAHMGACPQCTARVFEAANAPCEISARDTGLGCLSLQLGECIAERYVVCRTLGQGGMGEVYEAFDCELQRPVAIKTVRARTCDDPEVSRRLAKEFELAARVRHPNVRRVYQLGMHGVTHPFRVALPFISMDLIEGESLAKRLQRGPVGFSSFGTIASELLLGVAAIHRAGIIHRDIKSHNVLLGEEPAAPLAIIDFGVAIEANRIGRDRRGDWDGLEGSPAYMAPEQFDGAGVSFASDVFSCGVVLFQLLTGALPFRSLMCRRGAGVRRNPREVPCRVRAEAPGIPAAVDAFVARCLEVDARARYADACAALKALQDALAQP